MAMFSLKYSNRLFFYEREQTSNFYILLKIVIVKVSTALQLLQVVVVLYLSQAIII